MMMVYEFQRILEKEHLAVEVKVRWETESYKDV